MNVKEDNGESFKNINTYDNEAVKSQKQSEKILALEKEFEQLVKINSLVNSVIKTMEIISTDIDKINESSRNSQTLLDQWIKILSQTNFTNKIIDDLNWNGIYSNKILEKNAEEEEENTHEIREDKLLFHEQNLNQLIDTIELENINIKKDIENIEMEEKNRQNKSKELLEKRRRDLGLTNNFLKNNHRQRITKKSKF